MTQNEMPDRPHEHELESLSRHAFHGLVLQQGWHHRPLDTTAEYGIDEEVEIFERGKATGLTFRVQAKGVGKPDKIGPYSDVKLKTFAYWASLDTPVLLVLWVESTNILYGRWVHSYDFGPKPKGKKTHRVRFDEADKLTTRITSIRDEVEVFRLLGRGGVPHPLPLAVTVEPDHLRPAFIYTLNQYLAQNGLRNNVRVVEQTPSTWTARVLPDRLRVEQPSNAGSETHWVKSYSTVVPAAAAASDILVSLGVLIAKLGATSDAVRLFRAAHPRALALHTPKTARHFALIAAHEDAVDLILTQVLELLPRLGEPDFDEPDLDDLFNGYWFILFSKADALSKDDLKALRKEAKRAIDKAEHAGRQKDAARLANNVSAMMKAAGAYKRVEEFLDLAARLDPAAYAARGDVLLSRGNARWHLGDFVGAAEAYRAARTAGLEDSHVIPPLSDVLFETGRYREALDLLNGWLTSEDDVDARSILRYIILEEVVEGLGLDEQERNYNPGLCTQLQNSDDQAVREAQVASDALDLDLWMLRSEEDEPIIGKWALLAFRLGMPQAWINTLIIASDSHANQKLTSILIDGAIESVEVVEAAKEMSEATDMEELSRFLGEIVQRAYARENLAIESKRINFVDDSNDIVTSVIFDDDGNILNLVDKMGDAGHD